MEKGGYELQFIKYLTILGSNLLSFYKGETNMISANKVNG